MLLPVNQHNLPPIARDSVFLTKQEGMRHMLFDPSIQTQVCNNVLMSDGRFLYKSKDLKTVEVEDLRDSLNFANYHWSFKALGFEMEIVIEPLDTNRQRTQFLVWLNVHNIDFTKVSPNSFVIVGIQVYPDNLANECSFCFFYLCAKQIVERDEKLFGPLWSSDKHIIPLPVSLTLFTHFTYGDQSGPDHSAMEMLKNADGISFRNPLSFKAPTTYETVQLMKSENCKRSRQSFNLRLIGSNTERHFCTSLENAVPHCRKVEKELRENDNGLFRMKFNDFTEDKPKTLKLNCDINQRSVCILEQLFAWGRISPLQLVEVRHLIKAKSLAAELKADSQYWALAVLTAVLAPIDKSYQPNEFFEMAYDVLHGGQIDQIIKACRNGDKVKLVGPTMLFSPLLFIAHQSGGIQNLPKELLQMSPESLNLLVQMKDSFDTALTLTESESIIDL